MPTGCESLMRSMYQSDHLAYHANLHSVCIWVTLYHATAQQCKVCAATCNWSPNETLANMQRPAFSSTEAYN